MVLKLDEIWSSRLRTDAKAKATAHGTKITRCNRRRDDGIQPRRTAWDSGGVQREVS